MGKGSMTAFLCQLPSVLSMRGMPAIQTTFILGTQGLLRELPLSMLASIEAVVEKDGRLRPLERVSVREGTHAIVTFLSDEQHSNETALLSEAALSDWNRPEEDAAWAYLQKGQ